MRDPHVERLHYSARSGTPDVSYREPADLVFANQLGNFELRDMKLTFHPTEHFGSQEHAREAVERFLKSWEIDTDLTQGHGTIRFDFDRADIVDRDPPPPGTPIVAHGRAAVAFAVAMNATVHLTWNRYPPPPTNFRATTDVEMGYWRWMRYRDGKESLQTTAYAVLSLIVEPLGGRKSAAKKLAISDNVLSKITELSSTKGNANTLRKASSPNRPFVELTALEQTWIEQAIKRLLLRVGEHAAGGALTPITLVDLPPV